MAKKKKSSRKAIRSQRPPTIEEGFLDPERFPIDGVVKEALGDDLYDFEWAIALLRTMWNYNRKEAGVVLLGLLLTCGDNWEKRMIIARALYDVQTEACVEVLFGELRRIKNTNSTRRYLKEVVDVLSCMPPKLVRRGFESLAADETQSYRMRAKYQSILEELDEQEWIDSRAEA